MNIEELEVKVRELDKEQRKYHTELFTKRKAEIERKQQEFQAQHEAILQAAREQGKFLCKYCAEAEMEADNMVCSACEAAYAVDWLEDTAEGKYFRRRIYHDIDTLKRTIKGIATLYKGEFPDMPPEYKLYLVAAFISKELAKAPWHETFGEEKDADDSEQTDSNELDDGEFEISLPG